MDKLEHFAGLLVDLEIAKDVLPVLLENGFDDWEQTAEIEQNPKILDQIGITDAQVQSKILAAISVANEHQPSEEEIKEQKQREKEIKKQQQEEEKQNQEMIKQQQKQKQAEQQYINLYENTPQKQLSVKDLMLEVSVKKRNTIKNQHMFSQDKREQLILEELTVVSLNDKKYTNIDNIVKCVNLQNLHLLGNSLFSMDQCFLNLQKLTIIQLQDNYIAKIEHLQNCQQLKKLFLNGNYISKLEGLENCPMLEEIQLSNQKSGQEFTFCEQSCQTLGHSLSILQIENSNIKHIPEYFSHMQGIQNLKLRNNKLSNYEEFIEPFKNFPYLQDLYLKGNPLTQIPKYRDKFVLISKSLENLDDKKILPHERQFLFQLWRKKNGMLEQPKTTERKKQAGLQKVSGQQVKIVYQDEQEYRDPKSYQKLNSNLDFHGNTTQQSSKHVPNSKYYG